MFPYTYKFSSIHTNKHELNYNQIIFRSRFVPYGAMRGRRHIIIARPRTDGQRKLLSYTKIWKRTHTNHIYISKKRASGSESECVVAPSHTNNIFHYNYSNNSIFILLFILKCTSSQQTLIQTYFEHGQDTLDGGVGGGWRRNSHIRREHPAVGKCGKELLDIQYWWDS